ncbi:MAG: hypothetical protein SGARI_000952 [Bacillariaceae sp.]
MPADYPPHGEKSKILRRETMASSVMATGDPQLHGATADMYGSKLEAPVFPGSNADNKYWHELREVVEVQKARRSKAEPNSVNRWPDLWQGYDLEEIAQLVHDEYPASLQQSMLYGLFKEGVKLNYDIIPFRSVVDFVATEVRMAKLNTWVVDTIAPISFMMKWHTGMPRPEEIAWLIHSGAFTGRDGVPADLQNDIRDFKMDHATNFTAYPEGSPTHPSWPAMHSAASTLSFWLPVVVKLTPAQYCEALRVDYAVSYARTVAGVHYPQDNYAGLNLGKEVILEKFPDMMYERYGADPEAVRSRMEYLKFDWHAFDSWDCTIGGIPAADWLGEMAA